MKKPTNPIDPGITAEATPDAALEAARVGLNAIGNVPGQFNEETCIVLDSIAEGVVVFDSMFRVQYANREAGRLLGKIVGKELDDIIESLVVIETEEEILPVNYPIRKAFRDGFPIKTTAMWRRDSEHEHAVEILATPIRDDQEAIGVVAAIRNVENQLSVERELREFIAIASHQFRTPLASIAWFLEILLSGKVGELEKQQWEMVQQAREAVTRLNDTIHLTLNASSMEFGALAISPEPHDIGKLLKEEVSHIELFAKRKNQKIKLLLPRTMPTIPIDETIFRFIMMNLLSNAVKYSPEKAEIIIEVTAESRRMKISIVDKGVGIPEADQERIFTKFFRGKNVLMKSDGTGLGLYIVKSLIDRVGGSIWFDSVEGKGTTFTITIPSSGFKEVEGRTRLEALSKSLYGNS